MIIPSPARFTVHLSPLQGERMGTRLGVEGALAGEKSR